MLVSNLEEAKIFKENKQSDCGKQHGDSMQQLISAIASSRCWEDLVDKQDEHHADKIGSKFNDQAPILIPIESPIRNNIRLQTNFRWYIYFHFSNLILTHNPNNCQEVILLSPNSFDNLQGDDIFEKARMKICQIYALQMQ